LSLPDTFLLLRLWSVLLASAVVPLSFYLTNRVTSTYLAPEAVSVFVAMFPGIYPDVARISNDALVVPLAAAIFLAVSRFLNTRSHRDGLVLALLLLAGLGTKAFFIPVVVAVAAAVLAMKQYRTAVTIVAVSAGGWVWYVRNLWLTGSMTGLPET